MPSKPQPPTLPEETRREIFLALVEAQDRRVSVPESREEVARQFGVSEEQVRQIEREGIDGDWLSS